MNRFHGSNHNTLFLIMIDLWDSGRDCNSQFIWLWQQFYCDDKDRIIFASFEASAVLQFFPFLLFLVERNKTQDSRRDGIMKCSSFIQYRQ